MDSMFLLFWQDSRDVLGYVRMRLSGLMAEWERVTGQPVFNFAIQPANPVIWTCLDIYKSVISAAVIINAKLQNNVSLITDSRLNGLDGEGNKHRCV